MTGAVKLLAMSQRESPLNSFDDFAQEGFVALLACRARHAQDRSTKLLTYAWPRIAGAMKNAERPQWRHARVQAAIRGARGARGDVQPTTTSTADFERDMALRQLAALFLEILPRELNSRERKLVRLIYGRGLSMLEAGRLLGCSEGRISQVHGGIVRKLREALLRRGVRGSADVL